MSCTVGVRGSFVTLSSGADCFLPLVGFAYVLLIILGEPLLLTCSCFSPRSQWGFYPASKFALDVNLRQAQRTVCFLDRLPPSMIYAFSPTCFREFIFGSRVRRIVSSHGSLCVLGARAGKQMYCGPGTTIPLGSAPP